MTEDADHIFEGSLSHLVMIEHVENELHGFAVSLALRPIKPGTRFRGRLFSDTGRKAVEGAAFSRADRREKRMMDLAIRLCKYPASTIKVSQRLLEVGEP